jgi:hypothetical protein
MSNISKYKATVCERDKQKGKVTTTATTAHITPPDSTRYIQGHKIKSNLLVLTGEYSSISLQTSFVALQQQTYLLTDVLK